MDLTNPIDRQVLHWQACGSKRQRIEYWNEVICRAVLNVEMTTPISEENQLFLGDIRSKTQLNSKFIDFRSSGHSISRSKKHANRNDDSFIMVSLQCNGRSSLHQNGREIVLEPGDIGILDSGLPFDLHFPEKVSRRIVMIPRQLIHSRLRKISTGIGPIKISANFELMPVLTQTIRLLTLSDQLLKDNHVNVLLESVADYLSIGLHQEIEAPSLSLATFEQIIYYINQNISLSELNAASTASSMRVSIRTLHRLFKRFCNLSYEQYVMQCRLQLAKKILHSGNCATVSEAAFTAGFNDVSHFTRRFKEAFGVTPSSLI